LAMVSTSTSSQNYLEALLVDAPSKSVAGLFLVMQQMKHDL